MTIPTANPIASNIVKPIILPCVKQEVGSTLGATQSALSSITPSPIGNAPVLQQVQVPTPVLQPVVQVHKSVPTPVLQHPANAATNRTIGRPQGVHPAAMQQQRVVKSPPQHKASKKKKAAVSMATAQSATSSNQGENTGRWTAEEHRLFLQGLEQHGKGWKKIASLIKSRTVVQIRTHAQKYFQKIAKARQNGEEGEVSMENRERVVVSNSHKRKRGTKRKPIASVVASAVRESKKQATEKMKANTSRSGSSSNDNYVALPEVAPALAPYVYPMGVPQPAPQVDGQITPTESVYSAAVPSITTAHGTISGAALEDSL
jgi:SHAQKYF class myb-like DNA-binding protein